MDFASNPIVVPSDVYQKVLPSERGFVKLKSCCKSDFCEHRVPSAHQQCRGIAFMRSQDKNLQVCSIAQMIAFEPNLQLKVDMLSPNRAISRLHRNLLYYLSIIFLFYWRKQGDFPEVVLTLFDHDILRMQTQSLNLAEY